MYKLLFGVVLFLSFQACQSPANQEDSEKAETMEAQGEQASFGEEVNQENIMSYEEMITALESRDSVAAVVKASVEDVCQAKGCWMNVTNEQGEGEKLFVQFKDYGFFVPKDLGGGKVIMEGYAYRDITSVEELKHYAEDEGKSPDEIAAITEPEEQLKFLASGVVVVE